MQFPVNACGKEKKYSPGTWTCSTEVSGHRFWSGPISLNVAVD